MALHFRHATAVDHPQRLLGHDEAQQVRHFRTKVARPAPPQEGIGRAAPCLVDKQKGGAVHTQRIAVRGDDQAIDALTQYIDAEYAHAG
jgi:hypothetical protein